MKGVKPSRVTESLLTALWTEVAQLKSPVKPTKYLRPTLCPNCGNRLDWWPEYGRYHCKRCNQYPDDDKIEEGGLTARAFKTPILEKRRLSEESIVNYCRVLGRDGPRRSFEIWSDGMQTDLVAVSTASDMEHVASQLTSTFIGAQAPTHSHRDERRAGTDVRTLLPAWLRTGLYFKVLNCRQAFPFTPFSELKLDSSPLISMLVTIQSLKRFNQDKKVYVWVQVNWRGHDWGEYAREYARLKQPQVMEPLQSDITGEVSVGPRQKSVVLTPEKELGTKVAEAIREPHVLANMRIAVFSNDLQSLTVAAEGIKGALSAFKGRRGGFLLADEAPFEYDAPGKRVTNEAALTQVAKRAIGTPPDRFVRRFLDMLMRGTQEDIVVERQPIPALLMTANELALFVHLPATAGAAGLTSIDWTRGEAPLPISPIYTPEEEGFLIGHVIEGGIQKPFIVDIEALRQHGYILGSSGAGKSNLLALLVLGLSKMMSEGKFRGSIFVVDPPGSLVNTILERLPDETLPNTHYFDPRATPWGMNMLALPSYSDDKTRDLLSSACRDNFIKIVRETIRGISGRDTWGHRLEYVMRETLNALYRARDPKNPGKRNDAPTLYELVDLVGAIGNEEELAEKLRTYHLEPQDEEFLFTVFRQFPMEAKSTVYTRIGWFLDPLIRSFTCSQENNLNFAELAKPGNITLFSFQGFSTQETAVTALMCNVIMNVYLADLLNKADVPEDKRPLTILIIDEFGKAESVAAFEDILSLARKFSLSLILSHQGLEQISKELRKSVMNNVRTLFFFKLGGSAAEEISKDVDLPLFREVARELASMPEYNAIVRMRTKGTFEQRPPFRVHTTPTPPARRSFDYVKVFMMSRMAKHRPPPWVDKKGVEKPEKRCDEYWMLHSGVFPRPQNYPVLFAIRDCFMTGLIEAAATNRALLEYGTWPTLDRLWNWIQQMRNVYTYASMMGRQRMIESVEQLRSTGFIREVSLSGRALGLALPDNPLIRSLVLFDVSAGMSVTGGGDEHRRIVFSFLEYYVRQKMHLPKYVEQAGADPDGILIPPSPTGERWLFDKPIAVEVEINATSNWNARVKNNIARDFGYGFSKVIVVCNTEDDARNIRDRVRSELSDVRHMVEVHFWRGATTHS